MARRRFLAAVHDGDSTEAVSELLRAKELSPDEPDQDGHTPLWLAAVHGATPVVRVLLEAGAAVNEVSPADKVKLPALRCC